MKMLANLLFIYFINLEMLSVFEIYGLIFTKCRLQMEQYDDDLIDEMISTSDSVFKMKSIPYFIIFLIPR